MLRIFLLLICFSVKADDISFILKKYNIPSNTHQLILVKNLKTPVVDIYLLQKTRSTWKQISPIIAANVGSKGISSHKKEGDDKTPEGLFSLGTAFGYESMNLKVNYRLVTATDKFIDDPNDPNYNQWVHGDTNAASYENMLRDDGIYKYGIVINYNTNPIVKGRGSAIFLHIWYGYNIGSIGCITISEDNMLKTLKWLDKSQNPYILITN